MLARPLALLTCSGIVLAPGSSATEAVTPGSFGSTFVVAGDLNGDGETEIVVGDPMAGPERGCVYVFDGADCRILRTFEGELGFGSEVAWIGGAEPRIVALDQAALRLDFFDPASGERVRSFSLESLDSEVEKLKPVLLDSVSGTDGSGTLGLLLQGRLSTGSGWYAFVSADEDAEQLPLRRLPPVPYESRGVYFVPLWSAETGAALVHLVASPVSLELRALDTGEVVSRLAVPLKDPEDGFGRQRAVAPLGDVDGDGTIDLVLSLRSAGGRLRAISGATGEVLWERTGAEIGVGLGNAVLAYGELEEQPESGGLLVAGYEFTDECLLVLSRRDGAIQWRSPPCGAFMGWELAGVLREGSRPPMLIGSEHSPYAGCCDRLLGFELGADYACLILRRPE